MAGQEVTEGERAQGSQRGAGAGRVGRAGGRRQDDSAALDRQRVAAQERAVAAVEQADVAG